MISSIQAPSANVIGADQIVARVASVVVAARPAGLPVILTQEAHRPGGVDAGREADAETGELYSSADTGSAVLAHCIEGTRGIDIVDDELTPQPDDFRIVTRRYNSFLGPSTPSDPPATNPPTTEASTAPARDHNEDLCHPKMVVT